MFPIETIYRRAEIHPRTALGLETNPLQYPPKRTEQGPKGRVATTTTLGLSVSLPVSFVCEETLAVV